MTAKLSPAQQRLFDALTGQGDVAIDLLFDVVYPDATADVRRLKQQYLGPIITRLNRRIAGKKQAVKPGALKGTYRLTAV